MHDVLTQHSYKLAAVIEHAVQLLVCVQVAMRRTLLLASVCVNASEDVAHWTERYRKLIVGPQGENVSVLKGFTLATKMASELKAKCGQRPPLCVEESKQCMTLTITDPSSFQQASLCTCLAS